MIVTGASSGPSISAYSGTPSSASTVRPRPRSWPNGSSSSGSSCSRSQADHHLLGGDDRSRARRDRRAGHQPGHPGDPPPVGHQLSRPVLPSAAAGSAAESGRRGSVRGVCYSRVASGHPAAEPRHDVIGQRAERVGPLLGGRLARIARPEQHHLVARDHAARRRSRPRSGSCTRVPEIVHRFPAGLHLRGISGVPRNPLRVPERHQSQGGVGAGRVAVPVGHGGAGRAPA